MFGNQTLTSKVLTDLEQVLSQGDPASRNIWQHLQVFLVVTTRVCVCVHMHTTDRRWLGMLLSTHNV